MSKSEIKITGRLPILSDNLPTIGLKRNWIKEYIATNTPIPKSDIPIWLLAKVGKIGIRIPNPSKSINIVIKIINNAFLFFIFPNYF